MAEDSEKRYDMVLGIDPGEECETAEHIVEAIMTTHWDLGPCYCWVCKRGRKAGLGAMRRWLRLPVKEDG